MSKVDMTVDIGGLKMKNPVLTASGTFGYGLEFQRFYDIQLLGGIVVKGTTLKPRAGNPPPRVVETAAGMLNSVGLENPGVDHLIEHIMPKLAPLDLAVIINISGNTVEEYGLLAEKLDRVPGVKGLEVNISCPNVKAGGLAFGTCPTQAAAVIRAVRQATRLPVIAKLSPNVTDIVSIARSVEEAGADAVSLINTLLGMAIDIKQKKPVLANTFGGLSGPAIKPVALRMVWQVSRAVKIPVIGMGGIVSVEDALEFLMAGASAVAVGAGSFVNPYLALEIVRGLESYCRTEGVASVRQLTGLAWPESRGGTR
ncbi:MAG TPA: dihydroorotate dehydrogenase [Clostridia bacterium]|nr:dihydroorotate dehydrogenase [Clostridia bacterium]